MVLSAAVAVQGADEDFLEQEPAEECQITNTSCPCAVRASSGMCMRHQGSNQCLMGECSEGYKCDCLGFEICTISSCAKFTTAENAIPSVDTPFQCHLTPGAGTCIDFDSFKDSVVATDAAKEESTQSVKTVTEDYIAVTSDIAEINQDKVVIDEAIKELDAYPADITEEERSDVEEDVLQAVEDMAEAARQSAELQEAVVEATKADLESAKERRNAYRRQKEAKEAEKELTEEEKKPENKKKCNKCDKLKEKIRALRKARREAAIRAGTWTKKCRDAKKRGRSCRKKVNKSKLSCKEARKRCVDKSRAILRRLRGQLL